MNYYIVDTFTTSMFSGNPTGVCILTEPLAQDVMQKIAEENRYSETAFARKLNNLYLLQFFTPEKEVPFCLHATLGAAYVIHHFLEDDMKMLSFETKGGTVEVQCKGNTYQIQTAAFDHCPFSPSEKILQALGIQPKESYLSRDLVFLLDSQEDLLQLKPNFEKMKQLSDGLGVVVSAKGNDCDFVSRCFFPKLGVNEDMATGSSHCILAPLWASKLGKNKLIANQLSPRGGSLVCNVIGDRVIIQGQAVLYLRGEIQLP